MTITLTDDGTGETVWTGPASEFLDDNRDGLSDDEIGAIRALRPGATMMLGGGAAPLFAITATED